MEVSVSYDVSLLLRNNDIYFKGTYDKYTTPEVETIFDVEYLIGKYLESQKKTSLRTTYSQNVSGNLTLQYGSNTLNLEYNLDNKRNHSVKTEDGNSNSKGFNTYWLLKLMLQKLGYTDQFFIDNQQIKATSTFVPSGSQSNTTTDVSTNSNNNDNNNNKNDDSDVDVDVGVKGIFGDDNDDW